MGPGAGQLTRADYPAPAQPRSTNDEDAKSIASGATQCEHRSLDEVRHRSVRHRMHDLPRGLQRPAGAGQVALQPRLRSHSLQLSCANRMSGSQRNTRACRARLRTSQKEYRSCIYRSNRRPSPATSPRRRHRRRGSPQATAAARLSALAPASWATASASASDLSSPAHGDSIEPPCAYGTIAEDDK